MALLVVVIVLVVVGPILWQLPRTFWPLHLNSSATGFTGLYRRYSIVMFTGHASDVQTGSEARTIGSISAQTTSTGYSATTTVTDRRRVFKIHHTTFFLRDQAGTTRQFDAANVGPSIGNGHLVSAACLVHNGKSGNAFLVFNHTTGSVFVETTRRGMQNAPHGITKMVIRLPLAHQVLLWLLIVTWPLILLIALGAQWQLRWFRKHSIKPLVAALERHASGMR
jgi:hypothetical protein